MPAFAEHERKKVFQPLSPRPFKLLLDALNRLEQCSMLDLKD